MKEKEEERREGERGKGDTANETPLLSLVALTFPIDSQFFSALRDQETTLPFRLPHALSTLFQVVVVVFVVVACLLYAN